MESEIDEELETLRIPIEQLQWLFHQKDFTTTERKFVQFRDSYIIQEFINNYSSFH
jgi:hypothetical protein